MELKIQIGYAEILALIKQLPTNQILKLKAELNSNLVDDELKNESDSFQNILLKGPVMDDKQYEEFINNRKYFTTWRGL